MKRNYAVFFVLWLFFVSLTGYSQINQGGSPISFQNPWLLKSKLIFKTMPQVDVARLSAEDAINDLDKEIPWRFGENIPVNLNPANSGTWELFPKGDKIWRLGIKCPGAYSINLTFDKYHLPPGATLFVYNEDKSQVVGAFTDINNQPDMVFATTLITGDAIVIEYYEPPLPQFAGELNLNRVTHGYRDAFKYAKNFGTSGACEYNVVCPLAAGWENQVKSVCMLVTGGSGFCTGALVNNTSNNGVPYVLTANHCYSDPSSWVFWYNWQSPTCANPGSSPPYNSISGATLKAKYLDSDFCLVQMNSAPPASYNVYYAGWNKENVGASSGAGIHHPDGDIKKFSNSIVPFTSDTWSGTPADSHWKVMWNLGVTEPGSSGSPMFDQNHRLIGQLHGGPSSCGSSQLWDYYGKFSMSWDHGSTAATRLKDWLDPTNIATNTLEGYDPNAILGPPVANFSANNTNPGINTQVNFTDLSSNLPSSWSWSFSPATVTYLNSTTSASKNPQVSFNATGFYSVTLTATNAYGNNSVTKTNYINVISCNFSILPFSENFTSGILPSCWSQIDHQGNSQLWAFGVMTGQTPNPALNGNYAYLNSDGFGAGNTQNADLVTPMLDLTGYSSVTLQFSHYFNSYTGSSGTLSYSINNGSTWTQVQQFTTTSPTNPTVFNQTIAAVAGQSQVKFKWNYTGTYGNFWAIDDVMLTGTNSFTLAVTPPNQNVNTPAGSATFNVASNGPWNVSSDQTWCTVNPSGTGNGTITANYSQNTLPGSRVAFITVNVTGLNPVVVTVSQAGTAPALTVTPSNQNVAAVAGTTSFTVTSNSAWIVSSNQPWCTVTPSGNGNGTITATFSQNTLTASRIANVTVTVGGLSPFVVTVTQAGVPFTLAVTPPNQNVTTPAGSTTFDVVSNGSWIVTSDQSWCTLSPGGTGNGTIIATYTQNTGVAIRVANITTTVSGIPPVTVMVTQSGITPTLSVTPPNQSVTAPAGTTDFTVMTNSTWTANSDQPWCTVPNSGNGNGTLTATYIENTGTAQRIANITVLVNGLGPVVVTVTQEGLTPTLFVTPQNQNVTVVAGTTTFSVASNSNWTASSDATSWCTVTPSGTGNGTIMAAYNQNTSPNPRQAIVTVSVDGIAPINVTVSQEGSVGIAEITDGNFILFPNPNDGKFTISSNDHSIKEMTVNITDIHGKLISSDECRGKMSYSFDLSSQAKGSYLVQVVGEQTIFVCKVVVK
jgi:lysyl endopeptidase